MNSERARLLGNGTGGLDSIDEDTFDPHANGVDLPARLDASQAKTVVLHE